MLDTIRFWVAVLLVVSMPPALFFWLLVHPFAAFWRRLGPVAAYVSVSVPLLGMAVWLFTLRLRLTGTDYGTSYPAIAAAVPCLAAMFAIAIPRRRQLSSRVLSGVPELSRDEPGHLLTTGIYGRVRNPRYIEIVLAVAAYALFANHAGGYVVLALAFPGLYLIVILEERELRDRFGDEYAAYCERVPRFLPRRTDY